MPTNLTHDDERTLLAATGRASVASALAWIGEDHALAAGTDLHAVLAATLAAETAGFPADAALRRLSREIAESRLDPATMLFNAQIFPRAAALRQTLEIVASKTSSDKLGDITAGAVRRAQNQDPRTIETLCAVAGLTYEELRQRLDSSVSPPGVPTGNWSNAALDAAFEVLDAAVRGSGPTPAMGAIAARPVEQISAISGLASPEGWERVESLLAGGVPYEVLLTQRLVGGAWLQHRNRTSKWPIVAVALDLRDRLAHTGFDVALDREYGGDVRQADLVELVGGDKAVHMVVRRPASFEPILAVTFSLAKDGGSARKSLSAKIGMPPVRVPVAVVVLGGGFAERNETVTLVRTFEGRVFTEQTLDALVLHAQSIDSLTP